MSREPTFPKDAAVGAEAAEGADRGQNSRRNKQLVKGAAIGIGSAAIVAALLYANRTKRDNKNKS